MNSLWKQTEEEKVERKKKKAQTDQFFINNGVYDPKEVKKSRFVNGNYTIKTEVKGEIDLGNFNDKNETNNKNNE